MFCVRSTVIHEIFTQLLIQLNGRNFKRKAPFIIYLASLSCDWFLQILNKINFFLLHNVYHLSFYLLLLEIDISDLTMNNVVRVTFELDKREKEREKFKNWNAFRILVNFLLIFALNLRKGLLFLSNSKVSFWSRWDWGCKDSHWCAEYRCLFTWI